MAPFARVLPDESFAVLAFCAEKVTASGEFPRLADIAEHMGWRRSGGQVANTLEELATHGFVRIDRRPHGRPKLSFQMRPLGFTVARDWQRQPDLAKRGQR